LQRFRERLPRFGAGRLVIRFLGELPEGDRIFQLLLLPLELLQRELEAALLLAQRLRALLVVPEARLAALPLDQLDARALLLDVKAPPGARRSARPIAAARERSRASRRTLTERAPRPQRIRQREPHQAGAAKQRPLRASHAARGGGCVVIVPEAVEDAVRKETAKLQRERPASFARLPPGGVE